jgi:pilus assembly protein CpaF
MSRLMTMLGMAGTNLAEETMATMISRAVHIVVQVSRMQDGKRRITAISEVASREGNDIKMHNVFSFERTGLSSDGAILGRYRQVASSLLTERFHQAGVVRGAASGEIRK